jgi:hypothetical protein
MATLQELIAELEEAAKSRLEPGCSGVGIREPEASRLMTVAVRLYTLAYEQAEHSPLPENLDLSPTEACTAAAALLKSQALTPFEFAIWFSGGRLEPR